MEQTVGDLGEQGLLDHLQPLLRRHTQGLPLGTGDDCAVTPDGLVWTTDTMVEGTHFRLWDRPTIGWLGHKLGAVNLSDLASKGADPLYALLSLGLPATAPVDYVAQVLFGLITELEAVGARLIGGDTFRSPQWCLTVTVTGKLADLSRIPARHLARPGDNLYLTGWTGLAGGGLWLLEHGTAEQQRRWEELIFAQLRPVPRISQGRFLSRVCPRLAMMDLSDGLGIDARRLAKAGKVRVVIEEAQLPVRPVLEDFCAATGQDPLPHILWGGDDYELLLATDQVLPDEIDGVPVRRIGVVEEGEGLSLRRRDGTLEDLTPQGFEHFP